MLAENELMAIKRRGLVDVESDVRVELGATEATNSQYTPTLTRFALELCCLQLDVVEVVGGCHLGIGMMTQAVSVPAG